MIFIQHGPSWKPKTDEILKMNLAKGVIWDPREENIERIKDIKANNEDYRNIINMVDPKLYYAQFNTSIPKKLEQLKYYPNGTIIDRNYLRDTDKVKNNISEIINFEKSLGVNYYVSPTLYIESFNERFVDKIYDIYDWFDEMTPNTKKFATLLVHESAFDNSTYMNEFIDDFSNYIGRYNGIYLIIDRDNSSNIRNSFSPNRLSNVMQFIYYMKRMQFKVIVGYCGIESINYMAVGADVIGTGWFYSLRKFNRIEKGFEESSRMGHPKKRYTSINLLSELKIDEDIETIPQQYKEELQKIIFNNRPIDEKIINNSYDTIPTNTDFIQYFDTMNILSTRFEDITNIEDKIKYLEDIVNNATKNIKIYNEKHTLGQLTSKHLEDYKNAINSFKNDNFI